MSGYYDEEQEQWIEVPESVGKLYHQLSTRSTAHDALELIDDYRLQWSREAIDQHERDQKQFAAEKNRQDIKRGVGRALFVTADGMQIERRLDMVGRDQPFPNTIALAMRPKRMGLIDPGPMAPFEPVPHRYYDFKRSLNPNGLPIYEERTP